MTQNSTKTPKIALKLMIYVKLVENLVTVCQDVSEFDSVLYSLNWDLDCLIRSARPWKVLGRKDNVYKRSIVTEFFEPSKFGEQPNEYYEKFSSGLYTGLMDTARTLEGYGLISPILNELPKYELEYNCDILNLLEDYYGPDNAQKIQDYIDLNQEELDLLKRFYGEITKEKRLSLIRSFNSSSISIDSISDFLPSWCKDYIKVFGIGVVSEGKNEYTLPEYKNPTPLGYTDEKGIRKDMIEEIYREFPIGSVLRGSEIRTRFREIYRKYGLNPKASLIDFMEFFVIRKAKSEYEWYYRIVRRKKDEVMSGLG